MTAKGFRKISVLLMAALAVSILMAGCGNSGSGASGNVEITGSGNAAADSLGSPAGSVTETEAEEPAKAADLKEIYAKVGEAVELNSPLVLEDDYIYNIFGIEVSGLEDYIFSISEAAISAETIVIMKPSKDGDMKACRENLEAVKEYKASEMRDYLPEQFAVVEDGVISEKNGYLYLVISENKDSIIKLIESML